MKTKTKTKTKTSKELAEIVQDAISTGSIFKLQPVLEYFNNLSQDNVGRLVTDGSETREIVLVYTKTQVMSEFNNPEFVTKVVWALSPAVSNKGIASNYILMDCDPKKWNFV